jgi:peptidoglycan/xylan/chitin deacetylase (PgdA/CDA1 family)
MTLSGLASCRAFVSVRQRVQEAFAYPYGNYSKSVVELVEAAGYRAARTINVEIDHSLRTISTLGGTTFNFWYRLKQA